MAEKNKFAEFYALMEATGIDDKSDMKRDLCMQASKGRTTSLRELSPAEYEGLIQAFRKNGERMYNPLKKDRRICLCLMRDYGVSVDDWHVINKFCENPRICGKEFKKLNKDELKALQKKLRAIMVKIQDH